MTVTDNILQIVGYKNSGKTTLVCRMTERLAALGYRVGTVKHDVHDFEPDHPGTDTWKHRSSGAEKAAITSPNLTSLIENRGSSLEELIRTMSDMDFVMVEGFKQASYRKFVLIRSSEDLDLLESSNRIAAVVSWIPLDIAYVPVFRMDETESILRHMQKCLGIDRE